MRHFLFFILVINLSFSQQNDIFIVANEKYNSSDFVGSIEKYNELLIKGFHSPELYFNLGNAYYKLDSLANSIYYYEKGLKYFPNDYSLIQNLEYLNNLTVDDIESVPEDIVSKQFNDFIKYFSLDTWSIITLIIAMLSCILFISSITSSLRFICNLVLIGNASSNAAHNPSCSSLYVVIKVFSMLTYTKVY